MSINGPVHVPSQPNWPTNPSHVNTTISGKENLFPKAILESGKSHTSSSLTTKKVEKEVVETMLERTDDYKSSFFKVKRTQKNLEAVKTQISECLQKLNGNLTDIKIEMNIRFRLVEYILKRSLFCSESGRQTCLEDALNQINYMQQVAYFSCFTQMATYLLKVLDGVSCLDMNVVRDTLLNLRRADILSSNGSKELTEVVTFFETRWKELKEEGKLDKETYKLLNEQLKQILTEDPFRDEFIKNPELFKKVKDAPEALLKKYPHLASASDFLSRYPTAGWIELPNQTFNTENLKLCINKARTSPLARTLVLESADAIITPSHAYLIKNLIVEKQDLTVLLGNEDDLITLTTAFHEDKTIAFDEKTFLAGRTQINKSESEFILFGINSQSPIRKVQPQLEVKKTDSSLQSKPVQSTPSVSVPLQGTTRLIDGRVFLILDGKNGEKVLAVRDYEVEAVKKLNRKYVDENGITQEFHILGVGPEYYEKLDIIEGRIKEKHSSSIESMLQKHSSKK
ncbi:conserved hypothetical protein (plasmid) [Candidatus Protochlamydia naegleriophila]|uniref:Uncharacterized protein n=2 Tax=Candidatus Protochlamydia naegleriophila TaxID=389348 RepID=A0A0U5JG62_9BACT|nr:conserved hypothetical protein [Candidatus Protochlamydia naegleriophila]